MDNNIAALSYDNMDETCTLYVRSPRGRYKLASDEQILAAGRTAAESLISQSSPVDQPTKVKQFFQAKLAGLGHECAAFLYLDSRFKPIRYIEHGEAVRIFRSVRNPIGVPLKKKTGLKPV